VTDFSKDTHEIKS